jgi:diguanylate cyclase (GGDEF)-like protein/PAS domain S-box-containing protein
MSVADTPDQADPTSAHVAMTLALQPFLSELGIGVVVFDPDGTVVESNQRAKDMVTVEPGVFGSVHRADLVFEMFDVDGRAVSRDHLPVWRALQTGESVSNTVMGFGERGAMSTELIWMLIGAHLVRDEAGDIAYAITTFVDVTGQRAARDALADSERRFRLLAENAADMIFRVRMVPEVAFEYMNPAVRTVLGYEPSDFYADYELALRLIHPDDYDAVYARFTDALEAGVPEMEPIVLRMLRDDGTIIWTEYRIVPIVEGRTVVALEGIAFDVTARMAKEADLSYQAMHDPLTGLPNRGALLSVLDRALVRARSVEEEGLAVLYVDLDRFKTVNDNLGHEIGDRVLATVAVRIADAVRPSDSVARLGGDEFAAVLPGLRDPSEAVLIAERLLESIATSLSLDDGELVTTASVGVAFSEAGDETPSELLRRADVAMYVAKDNGRARLEQYVAVESGPRPDGVQG